MIRWLHGYQNPIILYYHIYNIYSKIEFLQFYALKIDLSCFTLTKFLKFGMGTAPPQTPPHAERKNQYCGRTTFQQLAPPLEPRLWIRTLDPLTLWSVTYFMVYGRYIILLVKRQPEMVTYIQ